MFCSPNRSDLLAGSEAVSCYATREIKNQNLSPLPTWRRPSSVKPKTVSPLSYDDSTTAQQLAKHSSNLRECRLCAALAKEPKLTSSLRVLSSTKTICPTSRSFHQPIRSFITTTGGTLSFAAASHGLLLPRLCCRAHHRLFGISA